MFQATRLYQEVHVKGWTEYRAYVSTLTAQSDEAGDFFVVHKVPYDPERREHGYIVSAYPTMRVDAADVIAVNDYSPAWKLEEIARSIPANVVEITVRQVPPRPNAYFYLMYLAEGTRYRFPTYNGEPVSFQDGEDAHQCNLRLADMISRRRRAQYRTPTPLGARRRTPGLAR